MAVKSNFSPDDFVAILATYNLGKFREVHPLSEGTVQTLFRLTTTSGEYIFKYYENRTCKSVQFEANAVNYIYARNFPCAAIFKNKQGQSVSLYNEKPYVIFEYIVGQTLPKLNEKQRQQVIHTAAQLQNLTRKYKPHLRKFRWNYSPKLCLQLAQDRAAQLDTPTAYGKLVWFEQTLAQLQLPMALPKSICHGDYDLSNILFKDGDLLALIDFDDANYTYLTFDLICLVEDAWQFGEDFNLEDARHTVQIYEQIRPLNAMEKRYLMDVHKLSILFDGIWFFDRGQVEDFYERQKIEYLDSLGREGYSSSLFAENS